MSLVLTIDPDDPTPPYEQLRRQPADLIAAGQRGGYRTSTCHGPTAAAPRHGGGLRGHARAPGFTDEEIVVALGKAAPG